MGGSHSQELSSYDHAEEGVQNFGSFKMVYLGSTTINPPASTDSVLAATNTILAKRNPKKKVAMNVSSLGVELFERKGKINSSVADTPLKNLSYISLIGRKNGMIAYVHKVTERVLVCHLARMKTGGQDAIHAVNQAFQAGKEQQRMERRQKKIAWGDSNAPTSTATETTSNEHPGSKNAEVDARASLTSTTSTTSSSSSSALALRNGDRQSLALSTSSSSLGHSTFLNVPPRAFKCEYIGHTTVTQMVGEETANESARQAMRSNKPRKALFEVGADMFQIKDKHGEVLQFSPIAELTFHTRGEKKPSILSFITKDKEGIMFCHTLRFKSKKECTRAIEELGKSIVSATQGNTQGEDGLSDSTNAFARRLTASTVSVQGGSKDPASLLGMFEAVYLGSVPTTAKRSQEACESAALSLLLTKPPNQTVAIAISGESVKIVDALTSDLVQNMVIKNITFTTMINDKSILKRDKGAKKGEGALCAFVYHDQRLQRISCEVFRAGKRAPQICESVQVAFQVAVDLSKKKKNNPFAPTSKKREAVPGPLFARQIHRRDLAPISVLGMGQFGEVYLARQYTKKGQGENGRDYINRACKMLRSAATAADRTEFLREAELMLNFDHPNLTSFIGVAVQQRPWLCVLEYMEYGDLRSVVKTAREKGMKFTILEFLKLIVQIAKGMEYLSGLGYIHMDLAARNCLLSSHNLVKIADFGLTVKVPEGKEYYRLRTTLKLPIKWMAVESITEKIFSPMSDVWSFGITCWEIFSYGRLPYPELKNAAVQDHVRNGGRSDKPPACPQVVFDLVLSPCWGTNWRERPTFNELRKRIIKLAKSARESSPSLRDVGRAIKVWDAKHQAEQEELIAQARGTSMSTTAEEEGDADHQRKSHHESTNGTNGHSNATSSTSKAIAVNGERDTHGAAETNLPEDPNRQPQQQGEEAEAEKKEKRFITIDMNSEPQKKKKPVKDVSTGVRVLTLSMEPDSGRKPIRSDAADNLADGDNTTQAAEVANLQLHTETNEGAPEKVEEEEKKEEEGRGAPVTTTSMPRCGLTMRALSKFAAKENVALDMTLAHVREAVMLARMEPGNGSFIAQCMASDPSTYSRDDVEHGGNAGADEQLAMDIAPPMVYVSYTSPETCTWGDFMSCLEQYDQRAKERHGMHAGECAFYIDFFADEQALRHTPRTSGSGSGDGASMATTCDAIRSAGGKVAVVVDASLTAFLSPAVLFAIACALTLPEMQSAEGSSSSRPAYHADNVVFAFSNTLKEAVREDAFQLAHAVSNLNVSQVLTSATGRAGAQAVLAESVLNRLPMVTFGTLMQQALTVQFADLCSAELDECKVASKGNAASLQTAMGLLLMLRGRFDDAISHYNAALQLMTSTSDGESGDAPAASLALRIAALGGIGEVLVLTRQYQQAEKALGQAVTLYETARDASNESVCQSSVTLLCAAQAYTCLAQATVAQRKSADVAIANYEKALAVHKSLPHGRGGEKKEEEEEQESAECASVYDGIGTVQRLRGQAADAVKSFERALEMKRRLLGDGHPDTAVTYNHLAIALRSQGDMDRAVACFESALNTIRAAYGEMHASTAAAYNGLANAVGSKGQSADALAYYEKALQIYLCVHGEAHQDTATTYNNMAIAHKNEGNYQRAVESAQKALQIKISTLGANHPSTAGTHVNLANIQRDSGDTEAALASLRKGLEIFSASLGLNHANTKKTQQQIDTLETFLAQQQQQQQKARPRQKSLLAEGDGSDVGSDAEA